MEIFFIFYIQKIINEWHMIWSLADTTIFKNINWLNYYSYICLNYSDIEMHQIQEAEDSTPRDVQYFPLYSPDQ